MAPLVGESSAMLAHRLMVRFGSIGGLLNAKPAELASCELAEEDWVVPLLSLLSLFRAGLYEQVQRSPLDPNDPALHLWLRGQFMGVTEEHLLGLFGDAQGRLITYETLAIGNRAELITSARSIFRRALTLEASVLILAHNHPSGCAAPSQTDVDSTRRLQDLGRSLGVEVTEHLIVTPGRVRGIIGRRSR